jgi:leucyl-tRNA synthetase
MELTNLMQDLRTDLRGTPTWTWAVETLLEMVAPIAPHSSEEAWHRSGKQGSIHLRRWPAFDEAMTLDEVVTIVVQVNGKVRDRLLVPRGEETESVTEQALTSPRVRAYIEGREIVRVVAIPDKLVNVVVK